MKKLTIVLISVAIVFFINYSEILYSQINPSRSSATDEYVYPRSLGVPYPVCPPDNPPTLLKVNLGRELFFDKRLSRDNSISCATCHDPNYGFSDPHRFSVGIEGRSTRRNSMSILNAAFFYPLGWDGKANSLEEQAFLPIISHEEFDISLAKMVEKLERQGYGPRFKETFGSKITPENVSRALAAYQRYLIAGDSPFDRFHYQKDSSAISKAAQIGFTVFLKVKCDACHLIMSPELHPFGSKTTLFTDNKFHNLGVGMDNPLPDPGRYEITNDSADWGTFRTPSLRNVSLTSPYFHDGSKKTLNEVVDFYNDGGIRNRNIDKEMKKLNLTDQDKINLIEFLKSLTSSRIKELKYESQKVHSNLAQKIKE